MSMSSSFTALVAAWNVKFTSIRTKFDFVITQIKTHILDVENPHRVDKFDVGLSKVQNQAPATPEQAVAGKNNNTTMSPLRTDQHLTTNVYNPLIAAMDDVLNDLNS